MLAKEARAPCAHAHMCASINKITIARSQVVSGKYKMQVQSRQQSSALFPGETIISVNALSPHNLLPTPLTLACSRELNCSHFCYCRSCRPLFSLSQWTINLCPFILQSPFPTLLSGTILRQFSLSMPRVQSVARSARACTAHEQFTMIIVSLSNESGGISRALPVN